MRRRSRSVDRLLAQLRDPRPEARCGAIRALSTVQHRWHRPPRPAARQIDQVFDALTKLLRHDPDPNARDAAAYALTFWFEPRAPAALVPVLEDAAEQPKIRGQAAEGIGNVLGCRIGSPSRRAVAIAALRCGLADASAEVRFWCVYALGTMRAEEARAEIAHLAATDEGACPSMWRVSHEAQDVLTFWSDGKWPDRAIDPAARAREM